MLVTAGKKRKPLTDRKDYLFNENNKISNKTLNTDEMSTNVKGESVSLNDAKPVLPTMTSRKPKCYNCKYASSAFKIAGKTHHQCLHPKHEEGFKSGELSPWDTLQEFYNTCDTHEFRQE